MKNRRLIFGFVLVIIGALLLGRSLDFFYFTFGQFIRQLIPIGFILLGIWLILRKKGQEDRLKAEMSRMTYAKATSAASAGVGPRPTTSKAYSQSGPQPATAGAEVGTGSAKYSKLLGDLFVDCNNINLQNVEISMGVGDAEIKLHGGRLGWGLNRMIISGFVGDIRIFMPSNIPFHAHFSSFVGDIDAGGQHAGGISNTVEAESEDYASAESKLYIAVTSFIGDMKLFVV